MKIPLKYSNHDMSSGEHVLKPGHCMSQFTIYAHAMIKTKMKPMVTYWFCKKFEFGKECDVPNCGTD